MAEETLPSQEITESLKESLANRLGKVTGGEIRGDKIPDILRSVEKSMFLQTSFLESINTTLKNSNAIAAETREDAERQANLASVSEDDLSLIHI